MENIIEICRKQNRRGDIIENQYIRLSDLRKVKGIGDKTIERIKETLLQNRCTNTDEEVKYNPNIDLKLNKFYIAESVEFMKANMPDNFVDLTVTSPPYDDLRKYNGFKFDYKAMLEELYRVTKAGGVVVWIVNDATVNGSETGTSFKQALYAKEVGFNLHDTMIYLKNGASFPAGVNSNRYSQVFEYMFIFSKGKPNVANLLKDKPNRWAGTKTFGTSSNRSREGRLEKRDKRVIGEFGYRYNVWKINNGRGYSASDDIAHEHPAIFPESLAQDHILSWSNVGDLVFDPMCGSGTTCKMAYLNKRNFIGVDISEEYINEICIPRLQESGWNEMD